MIDAVGAGAGAGADLLVSMLVLTMIVSPNTRTASRHCEV